MGIRLDWADDWTEYEEMLDRELEELQWRRKRWDRQVGERVLGSDGLVRAFESALHDYDPKFLQISAAGSAPVATV